MCDVEYEIYNLTAFAECSHRPGGPKPTHT